MPLLRSRLPLLAVVAARAALPACGTDDAVERDTRDTRQTLDEGAGNVDAKAEGAARDAGGKIERGVEDIDGR